MEIPHKDDLATNSKLPGMLTEDFKAIEQEESQLRDDLNDETDERKSADSDERNARIEADGRLQSQIDTIIQRLDKNEKSIADLQTRTSSLEDQVKKLNEIIFGTEHINDTDDIPLDDSMSQGKDVEINAIKAKHPLDEKTIVDFKHGYISEEVNN